MIGPRLRALGWAGLIVFTFIVLTTPNWRVGPLTWWPIARIDSPSRGTVVVGAVYALPVVAFGLWALGVGLTPHGPSSVVARLKRAWPMSVSVLMLVAWLLARVRWDLSRADALMASAALLMWWVMYLVIVGEAVDLQSLVALLVIVASVHALVGLGQFALQSDVGWQVFGEEQLNPVVGGITVIEIDSQRILRAYGLARHPNTVGGLLAVGALAAASGVWLGPSARRRWLYLAALGLITAGLVVTFSRSAWLGALGGGLMWAWAARPQQSRRWLAPLTRPLIIAVVLVSVIVGLFVLTRPELFTTRLLGGLSEQFRLEQGSLIARAQSWQTAWALIQQAPLLGVGVRGYLAAGASLMDGPLELAHNVPLLLWAEAGLGAAVLWLGVWGVMIWAIQRRPPGLLVALAWMTCLQVANQFNYYIAPAQNLQAPALLGWVCGAWAVSFACRASADRPAAPEDNGD